VGLGVLQFSFNKQFMMELHERWHNEGEKATCSWLLKHLRDRDHSRQLSTADMQFLCSRTMNLKPEQVKKLQNDHYNCFEALLSEIKWNKEFRVMPVIALTTSENVDILRSYEIYADCFRLL